MAPQLDLSGGIDFEAFGKRMGQLAGTPMGPMESEAYIKWTNDRDLKGDQVYSKNYVNLFRGEQGAFDGGKGPQAGPGFVQAQTNDWMSAMPVDTRQPSGSPQRTQQAAKQPSFVNVKRPDGTSVAVAVGSPVEAAVFQLNERANDVRRSPGAATRDRLDSTLNTIKAELNLQSARLKIEGATGRRGKAVAAGADMAPRFSEAQDMQSLERVFSASRGGSAKVTALELKRAREILPQSPSGQVVLANVDRKMNEAALKFQSAIAEKPPANFEEYIAVARQSAGNLADAMIPSLIASMPESTRKAFQDAAAEQSRRAYETAKTADERAYAEGLEAKKLSGKRAFTEQVMKANEDAGGPRATGQVIRLTDDGGFTIVSPTKEQMDQWAVQDAQKRLVSKFDLSDPEQRNVAAGAGIITPTVAAMKDELEQDKTTQVLFDKPVFKDQTDAGMSLMPEGEPQSIAQRIFSVKSEGDKTHYKQLIAAELKGLVESDAIGGESAYNAVFKQVEEIYSGLVNQGAVSQQQAHNKSRELAVMETDKGLEGVKTKFVSSMTPDNPKITQAAALVMRDDQKATPEELDREAMAIAQSSLNASEDTISAYQQLRNDSEVSKIMPNFHEAFMAARMAIDVAASGMAEKQIEEVKKYIEPISKRFSPGGGATDAEVAALLQVTGEKDLGFLQTAKGLQKAAQAWTTVQNMQVTDSSGKSIGYFKDPKVADSYNALKSFVDKDTFNSITQYLGRDENGLIGGHNNPLLNNAIISAAAGGEPAFTKMFLDPASIGLSGNSQDIPELVKTFAPEKLTEFNAKFEEARTAAQKNVGVTKADDKEAITIPEVVQKHNMQDLWIKGVSGDKTQARVAYAIALAKEQQEGYNTSLSAVRSVQQDLAADGFSMWGNGSDLGESLVEMAANAETIEEKLMLRRAVNSMVKQSAKYQQGVDQQRASGWNAAPEGNAMDELAERVREAYSKSPMGLRGGGELGITPGIKPEDVAEVSSTDTAVVNYMSSTAGKLDVDSRLYREAGLDPRVGLSAFLERTGFTNEEYLIARETVRKIVAREKAVELSERQSKTNAAIRAKAEASATRRSIDDQRKADLRKKLLGAE